MKCLFPLLLLVACSATPPPPVVPLDPLPDVAVKPLPAAPPVPTVVKKFDAAKAKEMSVVLGSEVTAEQIETIRHNDDRAKRALRTLGLQGKRPTAEAMQEARDAVKALETALEPP